MAVTEQKDRSSGAGVSDAPTEWTQSPGERHCSETPTEARDFTWALQLLVSPPVGCGQLLGPRPRPTPHWADL